MNAVFAPSRPQGVVRVPASKSCAHRMLICAAFARGKSIIRDVSFSEDICATMDCLKALGAKFFVDDSTISVEGGLNANASENLPCRESGSTLRFLIPTALLFGGGRFSGTKRLLDRGIGVYENLFAENAAFTRSSDTELQVSGNLIANDWQVPGNVSSQFISGLLFALPILKDDSTLTIIEPFESKGYVDLTVDALRQFGICISREGNTFRIPGRQKYIPADVQVEGDWSQAAFFEAMNVLGGSVELAGLNANSLQGDRICVPLLDQISKGFVNADLSDYPDLAPVLFASAAAFGHGAYFTGTRRLTIKESNRATVMQAELAKFGIQLQIEENAVKVLPGTLHAPAETLSGNNDHRIVMALSVLAAKTGGSIRGAESVCKSYPDFFECLQSLGIQVNLCKEDAR